MPDQATLNRCWEVWYELAPTHNAERGYCEELVDAVYQAATAFDVSATDMLASTLREVGRQHRERRVRGHGEPTAQARRANESQTGDYRFEQIRDLNDYLKKRRQRFTPA